MTLKKILKKIKKIEVNANNKINSLFAGNYCSVFLGRGIEFADLRPYVFGDDVRDIDWKTTARQGKVFVKKYNESRNNTLFFILDVSANMQFSSREEKKFENLLETFAVLAFAAVKNGDRVGVILSGKDEPVLFPPKKGRHNILKILTTALKFYKHKDYQIHHHDFVKDLKLVQKVLKKSSVVFWLSGRILDLNKNPEVVKRIKILSKKHDFIPVVFSDPEEKNLSLRGSYDFQDVYSGEIKNIIITDEVANEFNKNYQKKKREFLSFFRKMRVDSIFIDSSDEIFKSLLLFFKKRQKHLV